MSITDLRARADAVAAFHPCTCWPQNDKALIADLSAALQEQEEELDGLRRGLPTLKLYDGQTYLFFGMTREEILGLKARVAEQAQEVERLRAALSSAMSALQIALPFMQTDKFGSGPDCTPVFQAIIDVSAALKEKST